MLVHIDYAHVLYHLVQLDFEVKDGSAIATWSSFLQVELLSFGVDVIVCFIVCF